MLGTGKHLAGTGQDTVLMCFPRATRYSAAGSAFKFCCVTGHPLERCTTVPDDLQAGVFWTAHQYSPPRTPTQHHNASQIPILPSTKTWTFKAGTLKAGQFLPPTSHSHPMPLFACIFPRNFHKQLYCFHKSSPTECHNGENIIRR